MSTIKITVKLELYDSWDIEKGAGPDDMLDIIKEKTGIDIASTNMTVLARIATDSEPDKTGYKLADGDLVHLKLVNPDSVINILKGIEDENNDEDSSDADEVDDDEVIDKDSVNDTDGDKNMLTIKVNMEGDSPEERKNVLKKIMRKLEKELKSLA